MTAANDMLLGLFLVFEAISSSSAISKPSSGCFSDSLKGATLTLGYRALRTVNNAGEEGKGAGAIVCYVDALACCLVWNSHST